MPQILIDHQHTRRRPPQRDRALGQPVRQTRGLAVVLHLSRGGLADGRQAITMPGLDLAPARSQGSLTATLTALTPFPPLTTACTIRSTGRFSRRPTSTRFTSGNAAGTGTVAGAFTGIRGADPRPDVIRKCARGGICGPCTGTPAPQRGQCRVTGDWQRGAARG